MRFWAWYLDRWIFKSKIAAKPQADHCQLTVKRSRIVLNLWNPISLSSEYKRYGLHSVLFQICYSVIQNISGAVGDEYDLTWSILMILPGWATVAAPTLCGGRLDVVNSFGYPENWITADSFSSLLIYGSEAWHLLTEGAMLLSALDYRCIWSIVRIRWVHWVSTDEAYCSSGHEKSRSDHDNCSTPPKGDWTCFA